jgi:hypothetical protein
MEGGTADLDERKKTEVVKKKRKQHGGENTTSNRLSPDYIIITPLVSQSPVSPIPISYLPPIQLNVQRGNCLLGAYPTHLDPWFLTDLLACPFCHLVLSISNCLDHPRREGTPCATSGGLLLSSERRIHLSVHASLWGKQASRSIEATQGMSQTLLCSGNTYQKESSHCGC